MDQQACPTTPIGPTWRVSVPVSRRSGPRFTDEGQARGFTQDRAGAVLAAVHIVVRVTPHVGPAVFIRTLRDQVVGPDAAAMRVQVAQAYDELRDQEGVPDGQPIWRLSATLRGYRMLRLHRRRGGPAPADRSGGYFRWSADGEH